MRKIWYLKQEKGQKIRAVKVFLYEKDGHVEGRMDLSAFCCCRTGAGKNLLLHIKDAFGKDVGKISLEEGSASYESFFQGKGKLKEELANRIEVLKGETVLAVTLGNERYLSEGWLDREIMLEKGVFEEKEPNEEKKRQTGNEKREEKRKPDKEGKGQTEERRRKEKEETNGEGKTQMEGIIEELEAEELLEEEQEDKRIVQLSVLEDELLFRSYVHNSFLLHGYYNYGHIMIDESGEEPRLGVPGNYYEREQMVAEMFGFPVFETAREGEKITNGTFGYFYTKG